MQIVWYYSWAKDLDNKFRTRLNSQWKLRTLFHSRSTTSAISGPEIVCDALFFLDL